MWNFVLAIHFILCIFLIVIILLQSGKGSDMGAAFGGSSQTVFGPGGGATFLNKLTTWVAIGFLITSLFLAYQSTQRRESSLMKEGKKVEEKAKPAPAESKDKGKDNAPLAPQGESKGMVSPKEPEPSKPKEK